MRELNIKSYYRYKMLNSLFMGMSLGVVFVLYTPLKPEVYSIGGLVLAFLTLVLANLYFKILNLDWFYRLTLFVEIMMLFVVIVVLLFPFGYRLALYVYIGYQVMFVFGSYLIRAETLFVNKTEFLSKLDIVKQIGYIGGMGLSYLFYQVVQKQSSFEQVYHLHFFLLVVQLAVILFAYKSFKRI